MKRSVPPAGGEAATVGEADAEGCERRSCGTTPADTGCEADAEARGTTPAVGADTGLRGRRGSPQAPGAAVPMSAGGEPDRLRAGRGGPPAPELRNDARRAGCEADAEARERRELPCRCPRAASRTGCEATDAGVGVARRRRMGTDMLSKLKLEGYRGFDAYELADLSRVNLLVGPNNCGKTSILEAVHFLVSRGDPSVLTRSASRRGEVNDAGAEPGPRRGMRPDVSHVFFGHRLEPGLGFRLSADGGHGRVAVTVRPVDLDDESSLFEGAEDEESHANERPLVLQIEGASIGPVDLPVAENGVLLDSRLLRFRSPWSDADPPLPPVQFVTPDSLALDPMRTMWDQVLIEGRESEVIGAMQLLEPELDSIHFLTSDAPRMYSDRAGVLLGFRGAGRRTPMGSYGDGMRRLLALSLSLIRTAKGFLLIDEIDTGLHWTVMEGMWRLVVETARQSSIQVFATTHSLDCLRGLASLVESRPDLAGEISVQKIERRLKKAVGVDAQGLRVAVEQNIEVR